MKCLNSNVNSEAISNYSVYFCELVWQRHERCTVHNVSFSDSLLAFSKAFNTSMVCLKKGTVLLFSMIQLVPDLVN